MIKKNIILGVICLGLAGAMALVIAQGGEEAKDRQERSKPVTFYNGKKDMPSFEIHEEYTYYAQENSISTSLTSIRNLDAFEDDFLTPYVTNWNQEHDTDWTNQTLKNDYHSNKEGLYYWNYLYAYASYFALKKQVNLTKSVDFDYVFDGGLDCFSSPTKTQLYLHEKTVDYNFQPTFNLKRYMDTPANYFVFFAKSSIGSIKAETTFSLIKEENNQFIRYNFVFDNTYYHDTNLPTLYLGYFDSFKDKDGKSFDVNLLKNTTMIGLSYQQKASTSSPSNSAKNENSNEETSIEKFMKLYDIMLPFATWSKKQK